MRWLVTGSSGHLGEALMRMLRAEGREVMGLDLMPGDFTDIVGSITDPDLAAEAMRGVGAVLHTATLHKPHVATHARHDFVETNITGTSVLLEAAIRAGVGAFVFTSTTSTFGMALIPAAGAPAAWITEDTAPIPKNIYGTTKLSAEALCLEAAQRNELPVAILRTSRFFPEEDDRREMRAAFADANLKTNEFLFRRVDLEDAARAHILAAGKAPTIGPGPFIISAATPFRPEDAADLRLDPAAVIEARVPGSTAIYYKMGWRFPREISRVYDSSAALAALSWQPAYDFSRILEQAAAGTPIGSDLARAVGIKGYHDEIFEDGPYPVDH